jgi:hypothetical protein
MLLIAATAATAAIEATVIVTASFTVEGSFRSGSSHDALAVHH